MKKCFTFKNCTDSKLMKEFLKTVISSPIHLQLENSITVTDDMYSTAVMEGIKFAEKNDISCNWVDYNDNEIPLSFAPIAIINFKNTFVTSPHSISAICLAPVRHLIEFCDSLLNISIYLQILENGSILLMLKHPFSYDSHLEIANSIDELQHYIKDDVFDNIKLTDYYGKIIKVIEV